MEKPAEREQLSEILSEKTLVRILTVVLYIILGTAQLLISLWMYFLLSLFF